MFDLFIGKFPRSPFLGGRGGVGRWKIKVFINFSCHREKSLKTRASEEAKKGCTELEMRVHTELSLLHSKKRLMIPLRDEAASKKFMFTRSSEYKIRIDGHVWAVAGERAATTSLALCFPPFRSSQVRIK